MTAFLPPNLLALFAPREPIPYLPPLDKTLSEKKRAPYAGVGGYLSLFENPVEAPVQVRPETREERRERKKKERLEMMTYKLEQELARWTPQENADATGTDAYKTLFIARLNYDTSESKLKREFEHYGPISSVKMVMDKNSGKSKGYAFVEFEDERDMQTAFKHGDMKKIDGRRIVVDVERGRTVKGWKPRRLGGGRGGRKTGATDPLPGDNDKDRDRPPAGGPMRDRNDRGDDRRRERSPYTRPQDRGRPPGPYGNDRGGDRGGNGFDRGGPMRDDRRDRERNDFRGGDRDHRNDDRRPPRFDDRGGPPRNDERFGNRGGDRNIDQRRGGGGDRGDRGGGDRDRNGDRDRQRR